MCPSSEIMYPEFEPDRIMKSERVSVVGGGATATSNWQEKEERETKIGAICV